MCQTKCKLLRPIYRTWHHKASARTRLLVAGQPTSECLGRLTSGPTMDRSSSPTPCTNGSRLSVPLEQLTCFPVFGPIFAGKFQFSGMCDSGRWTRKDHEEIKVYGGADCLHPAAGRGRHSSR